MQGLENKATLVRRYIFEVAIIALSGCVAYLFNVTEKTNKFIREDLSKDKEQAIRVIEKNNLILESITNYMNYEKNNRFPEKVIQ